MTLRPTDMLRIQSAIDEYEKKFPRRPAPTAEEALAWRLGKREAAKFMSRTNDSGPTPPPSQQRPAAELQEPRRIRLGWFIVRMPRLNPALSDDMAPTVKGALRFGWWGILAVGTASIFLLGAFVGGFK